MVNGRCNCPLGKKLNNNDCVDKEIRCNGCNIENGKCICPKGKSLMNGTCINIIKCVNGKILGRKCICPNNTYVYINGKCVTFRRKLQFLKK